MKTRYQIAVTVLLTLTIGAIDGMARDMSLKRYLLDDEGGAIEVEAKHANDTQTRDAVRQQLQRDVRKQIPSATPAMKQHQKEIKYKYEKTNRGGRIHIVARSHDALAAVQEFLRSQIQDMKAARTVTFNFIRDTSLIVVPVNINEHGPYRFLLDTGASNTILSARVADTLGIPNGRAQTLLTAGGNVPVTVRTIDSMQIGEVRLDRVEMAVANFELMQSLQVDGILGGDYLRRFKISIDYDNHVVEIEVLPDTISTLLA